MRNKRNKKTVRVVLLGAGALISAVTALIAAEAFVALRREYIVDGPLQPVRGTFGDGSSTPLHFVVIGDSTALGVGTTPENSFPRKLSERLSNKYSVSLDVLAASGDRVADGADKHLPRALSLKPDLILIELGANDATHLTSPSRVRSDISRLLDGLKESGIHTVIAGPPNMGTSPAFAQPLRFLSGWSGRRVERVIRNEAKRRQIAYIDLAGGTERSFEQRPVDFYSLDVFHPGKEGYELWTDVMFEEVSKGAARAARSKSKS